jgi:hypothetical protein
MGANNGMQRIRDRHAINLVGFARELGIDPCTRVPPPVEGMDALEPLNAPFGVIR